MKRNTYISALIYCVALISAGFFSCKGIEWDTEESLRGMSVSWARQYVGTVINKYEDYQSTPLDSAGNRKLTITVHDTVAVESIFTGMYDGDSVYVTTTIVVVDSTMTVTTDGYRFANNLTAHIFTVPPGIIDYHGKLHIDFYQTDGMIPWAWTEVTYKNSFQNTRFGWY